MCEKTSRKGHRTGQGGFRIAFLVLGNREAYYSRAETKSRIKRFEDEVASLTQSETLDQFVLLDKTCYGIPPTLSVLGCTLFSHVAQEQIQSVNFGLNDFYHICDWSVEAHQEAHRTELEWLNHEIGSISRLEADRKVVVFTHYCPLTSKKVVDPKHEGSKISSGFIPIFGHMSCVIFGLFLWWSFCTISLNNMLNIKEQGEHT
jgi:hypothetical protein